MNLFFFVSMATNSIKTQVGGGLSTKNTIITTATKESSEEASIPSDYLMENLKPAGAVSFFYESNYGLFPNTEFVFDLELSEDFEPSNNDGEVEGFVLVTVEVWLPWLPFLFFSCHGYIIFLGSHGNREIIKIQNNLMPRDFGFFSQTRIHQ